jgi:predicted nucleic acid-binding protein
MTQAPRGPIVIDTGFFGAQLTPSTWPLGELYRPPLVEGRAALISFITVAELRFGAQLAAWGPRRLRRLEHELERAETIWPGPDLTGTYAALRAWCVNNGHGLGQKGARGRPVVAAATAIWLDIPLVAYDAIFASVEGLRLLTKLDP